MKGIIKKIKGTDYQGLNFDDVHLRMFFKALLEVDNTYYYYSVNHKEGPVRMQEHLERVFAYELYHQWSILITEYNKRQEDNQRRIINGEAGKKLDECSVFPDLILHKGQDDLHNQEIAVEIKRKIALSENNIIIDLSKLSDMLTEGKLCDNATPFKYGIFIVTGGTEDDVVPLLIKCKEKIENISNDIIWVFCQKKGEIQYQSMDEIRQSL